MLIAARAFADGSAPTLYLLRSATCAFPTLM
jgi:hypothetical protein